MPLAAFSIALLAVLVVSKNVLGHVLAVGFDCCASKKTVDVVVEVKVSRVKLMFVADDGQASGQAAREQAMTFASK